jgi:hypothetical protein
MKAKNIFYLFISVWRTFSSFVDNTEQLGCSGSDCAESLIPVPDYHKEQHLLIDWVENFNTSALSSLISNHTRRKERIAERCLSVKEFFYVAPIVNDEQRVRVMSAFMAHMSMTSGDLPHLCFTSSPTLVPSTSGELQ